MRELWSELSVGCVLLAQTVDRDEGGVSLERFWGIHSADKIIVCGCGRSLREAERFANYVRIGVNDVGQLMTPEYLVVLDPPRKFSRNRWKFIEESRAVYVFSHMTLPLSFSERVDLRLGTRGSTAIERAQGIPFAQNSPYVATCLAAYMGARVIGLIGVDFTEHHFFGQTGKHRLHDDIETIDRQYGKLRESFEASGRLLVNLSRESRIRKLPVVNADEFHRLEPG